MLASGANDSEDLLINCSSTRTTPAITSAWALVRESASPWSTSSLSMRSRFINDTLTQSERVSVARPRGKRLRYLDQPFPYGRASDTQRRAPCSTARGASLMCNSDAQSRHSQTTTRGASTQKKGETFPAILTASALCRRCNACTKNIPLYISPSVPSSRCMHSLSNINCFFIKEGPSSRAAPRELRYSDRNKILSRVLIVLEEKTGQGKPETRKLSSLGCHRRIMP